MILSFLKVWSLLWAWFPCLFSVRCEPKRDEMTHQFNLLTNFYNCFQCYVHGNYLSTGHLSTWYVTWPKSKIKAQLTSLWSNPTFSHGRWIRIRLGVSKSHSVRDKKVQPEVNIESPLTALKSFELSRKSGTPAKSTILFIPLRSVTIIYLLLVQLIT